ncbi:MAG: polyprenyl synthetase family protein [Microthrixaceae bacterium]|nr:polyprenyl synthetase family protein [Microthrixaceae bacterium]
MGNMRAILAGDFLLARASELAAGLGVEVAALLAATIGRLCEGQLLELQHAHDSTRTEASYLRSIDGKTASLLASACRIGGIVTQASDEHIEALDTFGHSYGMAFQMVDDVLDLVSTEAELGKPAGHDMEEGIYTLPVLHTLASPDGEALTELLGEDMDDPTRRKAIDIVKAGEGIPLHDRPRPADRRRGTHGSEHAPTQPRRHRSQRRSGLPDRHRGASLHLIDTVERAST